MAWLDFRTAVLAPEFAALRSLGDCDGIARTLNTADQPAGWVPPRHILSTLLTSGEIGVLEWIQRFGTVPGSGDPCPIPMYCLVVSILRATLSSEYAFKPSVAELTAGASALVSAGLITQATADTALAGEAQVSRSELMLGRAATAVDVDTAIKEQI